MRFRLIALFVLPAMIFLSCKKEDLTPDGVNPGNQYVPQLSKILTDNKISEEFVYNDSDMVKQQKSKYDFTTNVYNSAGKLIKSEIYGNENILSNDNSVSSTAMNQIALLTLEGSKKGGIINYEYNSSGQLLKSVSTRPSLTCNEYSLFTYDAGNRINKQTMYWEDAPTGYIDYTYDSKGNLTSEMLYSFTDEGKTILVTTSKYTYDSQPNPFKPFNKTMIPGIYSNTNNITKETYTIHVPVEQGGDKVVLTENTYTYNTLGYPVSKNGNVTYIYQ